MAVRYVAARRYGAEAYMYATEECKWISLSQQGSWSLWGRFQRQVATEKWYKESAQVVINVQNGRCCGLRTSLIPWHFHFAWEWRKGLVKIATHLVITWRIHWNCYTLVFVFYTCTWKNYVIEVWLRMGKSAVGIVVVYWCFVLVCFYFTLTKR